ncbi:MAG: hypothetical protein JWN46_1696 [Acidimicrobiales bacterium]|nr:hypothetical protein [Acidimicrobiales bacterium]
MVVSVSHIQRDVVTLTGADTVAYLQGQLSQDIAALAVGDVTWSFVLQPQGKVDAWVRVDRAGVETVRLDVDAGAGPDLLARLQRFLLRTDTKLELTTDVPVLAVRGAEVEDGVPAGWPGLAGSDVFDHDPSEPPDDLPADAVELHEEGYEALRIEHGVPRMGAELTADTIPAELGQWVIDASVSFTKGCFTGQELVARIDSRGGNVPRHLRGLRTDGPPPEPGAELTLDGKPAGMVTSSATDAEGRSVALAFVRRAVVPPADVLVADTPAHVIELPVPNVDATRS